MDSGFSESFSESHFDDSSDVAATSFDDVVPSAPSQQASFERSSTRGDRGRYGQQGGPADPPGRDFGRQPPHDNEAEQGVLGAMLLSPNTITDIIEELIPDDFYRPAHQLIYRAILDLFSDNKDVDPVIVAGRLDRNHDLERVGGAPYLHTLISSVPTAANARYYAEIVAEKAVLRRLVDAGTRVVQLGYEGTEGAEVDVVVDMAQQEVFAIAQRNVTEDYAILADILQPTMDELDELSTHGGLARGIPTGFIDLDKKTSGLQPGDLIIVAGRPSMGKTAFSINIAEHVAVESKLPVAVFSMEMGGAQLVMRMLGSVGRLDQHILKTGALQDEHWGRLNEAVNKLADAPMFIDETAGLTALELRARARRLARQFGGKLGLIVIDYLQLMESSGRTDNRAAALGEISRSLKSLAKELQVPIIALSQLSRSVEQRTDKRPMMSDLRESGAIEQDADLIMFMYRDEYYNPESPMKGLAECIIGKHRNGPVGKVYLTWMGQFTKFDNAAYVPDAAMMDE